MKIKEYLINLINKIKFNESGQVSWGAIPKSMYTPQYTPPTGLGKLAEKVLRKRVPGGTTSTQPITQQQPVTQPYVPPKVTQPRVTQPKTPSYTAPSIGAPPTIQAYQPFDWQSLIPQAPAAPVVTAQMIADWLSRARGEAGLMYDPQLAAISRELESSLLASEQTRGAIPGYYEDITRAIQDWLKTTTAEEQRRWYARGLGQGGGLIEAEKGLAETALKETTAAETEKARLLTNITQQEELLKKQAGAKGTEIEATRGQYITSRQAELRERYETNQAQISQQQFANQIQIAQFGFTAETQNFQNYLAQAELANTTWYNNALLKLQQETMTTSERARQEALQWEKQQFGQQMALSSAQLAEQARQFGITQAGQAGAKEPTYNINVGGKIVPMTQTQYLNWMRGTAPGTGTAWEMSDLEKEIMRLLGQ